MEYLTLIVLLLCLAGIVWQDLKFRQIHVALPFAIFTCGIYLLCTTYSAEQVIELVSVNTGFFIVAFFILMLYMSLRHNKFINPFRSYFGLGDLLFYIAVSPFFMLYNYVLFFISSLLFAILVFASFRHIIKKDNIPLAGYASLLFLVIGSVDLIFNFQSLTLIK